MITDNNKNRWQGGTNQWSSNDIDEIAIRIKEINEIRIKLCEIGPPRLPWSEQGRPPASISFWSSWPQASQTLRFVNFLFLLSLLWFWSIPNSSTRIVLIKKTLKDFAKTFSKFSSMRFLAPLWKSFCGPSFKRQGAAFQWLPGKYANRRAATRMFSAPRLRDQKLA